MTGRLSPGGSYDGVSALRRTVTLAVTGNRFHPDGGCLPGGCRFDSAGMPISTATVPWVMTDDLW